MIAASLLGAYGAVATFTQTRDLTTGEIRLSVSPGHRGALDLYVPLVDWGARFEAIRLPARLRVDLRTVDRRVVKKVAQGDALDVHDVRSEARDAIAGYLRSLIFVAMLAAAALGLLVAFAIRSRTGPRLLVTSAIAVGHGARLRARAVRVPPAEREHRPPAVLRPWRGHPACAGGRRRRPAILPRAR